MYNIDVRTQPIYEYFGEFCVFQHSFGRKASLDDMEEEELEAIIRELLNVPDYRHRTLQVSRLMHARKIPAAVATDAMERLMAFGGEHLRPHSAYSLSFVQFYMLDVLLVLYLCSSR